MEKKFTVFSYLEKVFITYGAILLLLNIFALIFGEGAKGISTIFSLGSQGISVKTSVQFLLACSVITALRLVFFTELVIKKMPLTARIILMFLSVLIVITGFILICGWFPADDAKAWVLFIICFALSSGISTFVSSLKERQENKALEEALKKVKEELV